jgi:ankyrin repeat protein
LPKKEYAVFCGLVHHNQNLEIVLEKYPHLLREILSDPHNPVVQSFKANADYWHGNTYLMRAIANASDNPNKKGTEAMEVSTKAIFRILGFLQSKEGKDHKDILTIEDIHGAQPLSLAIRTLNPRIASEIIRTIEKDKNNQSVINHCDGENGRTPLHLACITGSYDVCRILTDLGAKTDIKDKDGRTAFDYLDLPEPDRIAELKKVLKEVHFLPAIVMDQETLKRWSNQ